MGDVVFLPGVTASDLETGARQSESTLRWAIEKGMQNVTIVGNAADGGLLLVTSVSDVDKQIGMLMTAVNMLSTPDPFDTSGPTSA